MQPAVHEVVIYATELGRPKNGLLACLSAEERERFGRLKPVAASRFLAARSFLRAVLARHLGLPPREVCLASGSHGKPCLAEGGLEFNLSHTGDFMLLALSHGGPVGIDVETMRARSILELARRFFSSEEQAALAAAAEPEPLFFRLWTAREALLKLTGRGLAGLGEVAVDATSLSVARGPDAVLHALPAPAGMVATLACHPGQYPRFATAMETEWCRQTIVIP